MTTHHTDQPTLVLGASGKTGRRVAERLTARGIPVRRGSRSAETPFDWEDPKTWPAVVEGAGAAAGAAEHGVPADFVTLLTYLFSEVLDGRNSPVEDGVQRALGRAPRDFTQYARDAAATGVWNAQDRTVA